MPSKFTEGVIIPRRNYVDLNACARTHRVKCLGQLLNAFPNVSHVAFHNYDWD